MKRSRNSQSSKQQECNEKIKKKLHTKTQPIVRSEVKSTTVNQRKRQKNQYSIVICRGKVHGKVKLLKIDIRKVMLPYTAYDLKEKKQDKVKDFLNVAGSLAITHFLIFAYLKNALLLRVAKTQGPTLTFEICDYALASEITESKIQYRCPRDLFNKSPLIVISGFDSGDQHLKLTTAMFQNIFPIVDLEKASFSQYQRLVLLNYNSDTKLINFRHYSVRLAPAGVSPRIKSLITNQKVPNLDILEDVSDFLTKTCCGSDSEGEDADEINTTVKPASHKSKLILQEIGPRMTLRLVKIEEGLCMGTVLFKEFGKRVTDDTNLEDRDGANLDE